MPTRESCEVIRDILRPVRTIWPDPSFVEVFFWICVLECAYMAASYSLTYSHFVLLTLRPTSASTTSSRYDRTALRFRQARLTLANDEGGKSRLASRLRGANASDATRTSGRVVRSTYYHAIATVRRAACHFSTDRQARQPSDDILRRTAQKERSAYRA